jgi:glycine/D-amino acid oxidase-like deaminating enzyme
MTQPARDVVIVGAGIVGAACAEALSGEGFSVTVVESRGVSAGATAAGMGPHVVIDDSEAQYALTRYSVELWSRLAEAAPPEVEFDRCGTLWVAADEEEMSAVRAKHRFYGERGVATEILDARQVQEAEPNLRPGLAGGLRVPGDCVLYPPVAAQWLLDRAKERGAKLIHGEFVSIERGVVRLRDETRISAGFVVNAAGILSPRLVDGLDVRPRKGHLLITDRYPGFLRHQVIELGYLKSAHSTTSDSVAFNVQPRKTGQILIGSSRQYGSEDPAVEHPILRRMIRRAVEYMPGIAKLSAVRGWAGFRPSTPDKLPLIGPMPADPTHILATGHEGLGITTSLATARLVADHLLQRTSQIPGDPYLPGRFAREVAHA